jgi:hypothetical protein
LATDTETAAAISSHNTAANGHTTRGNTAGRPAAPTTGDVHINTETSFAEIYTGATYGWEQIGGIASTPTSVVATNSGSGRAYNNGSASVAFSAGTIAGRTYTVISSPGSYTVTGSGSPLLITGLQSSTQYTYTVTATNNYGTSSVSSASSAVTATTVPQAPTIGSPTSGEAQASIAFTANATGGSAITSYTATSSPGNFTGTGASSPITVTGLTNGTAYTFTVTATNANGTSTASSASSSVTPAVIYPTANLFARYDASNASSITLNGSSITTWNDISGNSRHATQSTNSFRPIYNSTTINGLQTILFDGTDDYFTIANTTVLTGNFTIYFIGKNNYSSATNGNGSWMIGSGESGLSFGVRNASNVYQIIPEGTSAFSMLASNVTIANGLSDSNLVKQAVLCWSGNGSGTIRWNKAANGTFNRTGFNPSTAINTIGNYNDTPGAGLFFKGEMAEILIYNTAHDLTTIQTIEAAITTKWGA